MFLDRVSQLGLLEHDPEANILLNFSLPVRKVLVKEVTDFLLSPSTPGNVLSTRAHAIYALETCGQGFRLPIEEADTISDVTELYRIWILEPRRRPAPIDQEFQFFLQTMLKHFSLLFASRSDAVVDRHIQLCNSVLDIFLGVGRVLEKKLSEATWEVFLKLLIGIADSLFLSPKEPSLLGLKLCNQVLKVIFECWLHSRTVNQDMWKYLKDRVRNWTHLSKTITHWQSFSLALNGRLLRLMYGPAHGTDAVNIRMDGEQYVLNLEDKYVFYAWHRVLTLLDDLNHIQNPGNFFQAFQGVEALVAEFLAVDKNLPPNCIAPDGNTILHIFGKWLFEAIQLSRSGFDEGTALAIKILSNIFTTNPNTRFLNVYLASYYRSLQEVLIRDGRTLISAILYSQELFSRLRHGSRILVQYFIYAITRIVVGNLAAEPYFVSKGVRAACISIIGQIFCLPKYFGTTSFKLKLTTKEKQAAVAKYQTGTMSSSSTPPPKSVFDAETYEELKPHIDYVLTEALKNETSVENTLQLLQLCYAHAITYINEPEFARIVVTTICGKCVTPKKWSACVIYAGLKVVGRMASLFQRLDKGKDVAKKIVTPLCGFVRGLCQDLYKPREGGGKDKHKVRLAVQTLETLTEWVICDQWIIDYPDRMKLVLDAVNMALAGPKPKVVTEVEVDAKKSKKEKSSKKEKKEAAATSTAVQIPTQSKKITNAANNLLVALLNRLGVFPTPGIGASSVSSLIVEEELLQDNVAKAYALGISVTDVKQFVRCFMLSNQVIISCVDQPFEEDGPTVTVIFRDCTGKYCWQFRSAFLSFAERNASSRTLEHCAVPVKTCSTPFQANVLPLGEDKFSNLTEALARKKWPFDPLALAGEMVSKEEEYLSQVHYNLNHAIAVDIPQSADPYISSCKFQQGRLLLTHLGLLSLENWGRIAPLEQTAGLFAQLRQLDETQSRSTQRIGVVYLKQGQHFADYIHNENGSLDYQEFLSSLGWGVHIPTHAGYLGNLDRSGLYGVYAPYYATHGLEVIFEAPTLFANSNSEQSHKINSVGTASTVVVWIEDPLESYVPDFGKANKIHIVVQSLLPDKNIHLYRVGIFLNMKIEDKLWGNEYKEILGPAMDKLIVSKYELGTLVRETAIDAAGIVEQYEPVKRTGQYDVRSRLIYDMAKKFRTVDPLESFYTGVLTALPSKSVAPTNGQIPTRLERSEVREIDGITVIGESKKPSSSDKKGKSSRSKKKSADNGEGVDDNDTSKSKSSKSSSKEKRKKKSEGSGESPEGSGGDVGRGARPETTWALPDSDARKKMSSHRENSSKIGETKTDKPIVAMSSQRMQIGEHSGEPAAKPRRPPKLAPLPAMEEDEEYGYE